MADFVRVPETDWQNICDTVREKTGGEARLFSGEVAAKIGEIEAGGGSSELMFETTFSLAESQIDVGKVAVATINTGLTEKDWDGTAEVTFVIECVNDTEADWTKRHWRACIGRIYCSSGYGAQSSKPYHWSKKSEDSGYSVYYYDAGLFISAVAKWAETITISTNSAYHTAWGFAPSGDYSIRIYKNDHRKFGLEIEYV